MHMANYSIVIPVFNEEETLEELYNRLGKVLKDLDGAYEIIFVDDGSFDKTKEILLNLCGKDPNIKIISFSRNFGHQAAITAGMEHSIGDAIIVMDADLQDPPEFITSLVSKWKEGWKVVYAIRQKRKEGFFKRISYSTFYWFLNKISYMDVPQDAGDFSIIDREIVDLIKTMPERNRFLRGLRSWVGFKQTGIVYERHERFAGNPKYSFLKLLKLATDGIVSFSYIPLRLATQLGFIVSGFAFVGAVFTLIQRLTIGTVPGFATTVISILFLGGVQLITIGILGEYMGRIYDEVKQRPIYITQELIGFENGDYLPKHNKKR